MALVKELEVSFKLLDAELNNRMQKAIRKDLEVRLKEGASPHTPSTNPKKVKIIADQLERMEKLISDIDVERAKVIQLEQNRIKIEKEAYRVIKESLRNKHASNLDLKQLEQNRKEAEKGTSLTSKEGLKNKFDSDVDAEQVNAKQSEKNHKEIMCNFVESEKDQFFNDDGQTSAMNPELH